MKIRCGVFSCMINQCKIESISSFQKIQGQSCRSTRRLQAGDSVSASVPKSPPWFCSISAESPPPSYGSNRLASTWPYKKLPDTAGPHTVHRKPAILLDPVTRGPCWLATPEMHRLISLHCTLSHALPFPSQRKLVSRSY